MSIGTHSIFGGGVNHIPDVAWEFPGRSPGAPSADSYLGGFMITRITLVVFFAALIADNANSQSALRLATEMILEIGDTTGTLFSEIGDIAVDDKGNIFVTDRYQNSVKEFGPDGRFKNDHAKGLRKADSFAAGPGRLDVRRNTLAVSDIGTARVVLLDGQGEGLTAMNASGPLIDMAFRKNGDLLCSTLPITGNLNEALQVYSAGGTVRSTLPLPRTGLPQPFQLIHIEVDRQDRVVAAYAFMNTVMIFDAALRLVRQFQARELPPVAPADTIDRDSYGIIPTGDVVKDVAVFHDSLIFILAAEFAEHPYRDVFVYDYKGDARAKLVLPSETGLICIDEKGFLYTREVGRTKIRKYELRLGR